MHVLLEVGDPQRAREARGARGGQHVVDARDVVADDRRRVDARRTPRPRAAPAGRAGRRPRTSARGARARSALAASIAWSRSVDEHERDRRDASVAAASLAPGRRGQQRVERERRRASATASSHVMTATAPPGPCSACASRSAATSVGSTVASATIATSDGPAKPSMPTTARPLRFASATYALPGPTITSTGGIDSVPYASAAIACAPPIRYSSSTSASAAAASTASSTRAVGAAAASTRTTSGTPATRAGTAVISTRRRERRPPAGHVAAGPVDRDDELAHVDAGPLVAALPSSRCASCQARIWSRANSSAGAQRRDRCGSSAASRSARGDREVVEPAAVERSVAYVAATRAHRHRGPHRRRRLGRASDVRRSPSSPRTSCEHGRSGTCRRSAGREPRTSMRVEDSRAAMGERPIVPAVPVSIGPAGFGTRPRSTCRGLPCRRRPRRALERRAPRSTTSPSGSRRWPSATATRPTPRSATELFGAERALLGARARRSTGPASLLEEATVTRRELGAQFGFDGARCTGVATLNADGQMSARTQTSQRGRRASQTWRPCSISRSESRPRSSGATMPSRSSSIFTGSVSFVSLKPARQPRHVRVDGKPGQLEPHRPHHVAGLAADAGQRHEVVELGRHLAAEALLERLRHADEALRLRAEEAGRHDQLSRRRRGRRAARSAGVGYFANSAGVTMLTRSSVVCAERIVATSSSNALLVVRARTARRDTSSRKPAHDLVGARPGTTRSGHGAEGTLGRR